MKNSFIKKLLMITIIFTFLFTFSVSSFGVSEDSENKSESAPNFEINFGTENEEIDTNDESQDNENDSNMPELNDASATIINGMSEKERKQKQYIDKYNDEILGKGAYIIDRIRYYSLPVCFIGITIGAFNFLIVGNKKLDKKEQGFGWIVGFTIGLVVFNVLPLLYALIAINR